MCYPVCTILVFLLTGVTKAVVCVSCLYNFTFCLTGVTKAVVCVILSVQFYILLLTGVTKTVVCVILSVQF